MNVSEHLTGEAIEHYRARRSGVAEMLAVQNHLAACTECRARLAAAVDADAAFSSLRRQIEEPADADTLEEETHLPYEQLSLYVDNKLDEVEREIADSHLAFCGECAADLSDLRQYQMLAAGAEELETNVAVVAPQSPTAWQRFLTLPGSFKLPLPATVAAVLVLLALGGGWLAMRNNDALKEREELAQSKPESDPTLAPDTTPSRENSPPPASSPPSINSKPAADGANNSAPTPAASIQSAPHAPSGVISPERDSASFVSPLIALNDGGTRVSLSQRGRLHGLEELRPETRQAVSRALRSRRIETPAALVNLANDEAGTLMGSGTGSVSFALLAPVGKIVRETQPVFRWQPLAGAKAYTVSIVDSKFQPVLQSPALGSATWTPAAALARGAVYYWQVKAMLADGTEVTSPVAPAAPARFRVLAAGDDFDLTQIEKTNPASPLARGVAYAQAGLIEAAEAEFEELLKQNPRSTVARDLLQSLRRASRRRGARPPNRPRR